MRPLACSSLRMRQSVASSPARMSGVLPPDRVDPVGPTLVRRPREQDYFVVRASATHRNRSMNRIVVERSALAAVRGGPAGSSATARPAMRPSAGACSMRWGSKARSSASGRAGFSTCSRLTCRWHGRSASAPGMSFSPPWPDFAIAAGRLTALTSARSSGTRSSRPARSSCRIRRCRSRPRTSSACRSTIGSAAPTR